MSQGSDTQDYRSLFLQDVPLMDMRAPSEFSAGAFPCATSLPLMSDDERAQVGTCYKQRGQSAAIELGHQLVSGELRSQRLAQWLKFAQDHPQGYLYCFRGGLRSQTVQQWLRDAGVEYPRVTGGYKAMRRFLLDEFESSLKRSQLTLISGKTGTGKTRVIYQLTQAIDLEGLAGHRGSSFGQLLLEQPSQIDFENALSIEFLKRLDGELDRVFLEDEGRLIGRRSLPPKLIEAMKQAPMLVVEQSLEERVQIVIADYVVDLGERFRQAYGDHGPFEHHAKLQKDLLKIQKRLGGARHRQVSELLEQAFEQSQDDCQAHEAWISTLLTDYYDPMYEYQLSRRSGEILFKGGRDEVVDMAASLAT